MGLDNDKILDSTNDFDDSDKEDPIKQKELEDKADKNTEQHLTPNELRRVRKKETTIREIRKEREKKAQAAEAKLEEFSKNKIISLKEYQELKKQVDSTKTAEPMTALLTKISEIPKEKGSLASKEKEEEKELPLEDSRLKALNKQFNKICDDNIHLIGTKQIPEFKKWFESELKSKPSIKNGKELIKKLEGKEIKDKNGLSPRREEFNELTRLYNKYHLGTPIKSDFIKKEGLSERQDYRKNAERMENQLRKMEGTGFYSKETIEQTMTNMLMAKDNHEQKKLLTEAENIAKLEAESFTHLDGKVNIGGITIRKISEKSKDNLIGYYKKIPIGKRQENISMWPKFIGAEVELAKDLEKVYKENPEGLRLALKSFTNLDFLEKQNAINEHKSLVDKEKDKEKLEKSLTIKAAKSSIDEAARKNIVSAKTQKSYKEFFEDENNFKDPVTKKSGNFEQLKYGYEMLVSDTPNRDYKNLKAYEVKRNRFKTELKELEDINPNIPNKDLKKWQEKYDKEGWTNRKKIYKEMKTEIEKQKKDKEKYKDLEEDGLISKDKKETNETLELTETIKRANKLLQENQGAEALKLLLAYNEQDPDNPKILFWIETVSKYMREFGSGKKQEANQEKQIDQTIDDIAENDESISEELEEQQIKTLNQEGALQSENRHDHKISAEERARKESVENAEDDTEEELIEDFYNQSDNTFILDNETKGQQINELNFGNRTLGYQEKQNLKKETIDNQSKLDKNEGFANIQLQDESGKNISAEAADIRQQEELNALEEKIANEAQTKEQTKLGGSIFDINSKIMARRKARELIEKERHQKLKRSA